MMSRIGMKKENEWNEGFTLIELLFVLLLLFAFLGMAAPVFRGAYQNIALDVAADRLMGLLNYGREKAVMERSRLRLEIEPTSGAYQLMLENLSVPGDFRPLRESLGRGMLLPEGTSITSNRSFIEFFPDGSVSEGSLTIIGSMHDIRRIDLDSISGEAKVYDFAQG